MQQQSLLRKHMPELDFWRGIAIGMVVLYHAFYWTQNTQHSRLASVFTAITSVGWLGVNLFFVLSGFLITGILLDRKGRKSYFRSFYERRARRILPAYILCLLLLGIFHIVSRGGVARALTFTANYGLIPAAQTYGPLWSLAVEEQFYLVWPLVALVTSRRRLGAICIILLLVEPMLRWAVATGVHPGFDVHSATFLIADSLALGAFGAIFFRSRLGTRRNSIILSATLAILGILILAIGRDAILHRTTPLGAAFQVVPFDMVFGAAVFGSIALKPSFLSGRISAPIRGLGYISYGLYLYHVIAFILYDRMVPEPNYEGRFAELVIRAVLCLGISVMFAYLSRVTLEERFLGTKPKSVSSPEAVAA